MAIFSLLCTCDLSFGEGGLKLIPDEKYYEFADSLQSALNGRTGPESLQIIPSLLSDDIIWCSPFVGVINDKYCVYGKQNVIQEIQVYNELNLTSLQRTNFQIAKWPEENKMGILYYYYATVLFNKQNQICETQFPGTFMFTLNPENTTQMNTFLEVYDYKQSIQEYNTCAN